MQKELQFLEEQDISPTLLAQVEAFREEYPVDKAALQRVNRPNIPFYGKEILEMSMAALLQGSNLLLSGAKATGKNILAENLAWIFGRPSYNISFKASVSGGYTNGGTIGSELGVTLGASKSYSLGSGYSVTVPKGSHYLIKYRPMYYTYKVVETKYKERYNEALGGMERYVVETKTCYVDVFSHWDFTHVAK